MQNLGHTFVPDRISKNHCTLVQEYYVKSITIYSPHKIITNMHLKDADCATKLITL